MIAILYVVFFLIYFALSVYVIVQASGYAHVRFGRGWVGGLLAFLLMYSLVFWDLIPAYVLRDNYCDAEAGFWVSKAADEWGQENPGVKGVQWENIRPSEKIDDHTRAYWLTDRLRLEVSRIKYFPPVVHRKESRLVDTDTGEALARYVDFETGRPAALSLGAESIDDYKIWFSLGRRYCGAGDKSEFSEKFYQYVRNLKSIIQGA